MAAPAAARASDPAARTAIEGVSAPVAYCRSTGGHAETRVPEYGQSSNPLVLSGSHRFCVYTSGGTSPSRIYVFLDTLYTTQPSLAALAYYAQVQPGTCNGNPGSCYCSLLGGSDQFGGAGSAGGGWVDKDGGPDPTLETCIFPDLSSIDSWGLLYHSQGIIRGIDLSTVLRYPDPNAKTHGGSKHPLPNLKVPGAQ
jgi:hypothetical protein